MALVTVEGSVTPSTFLATGSRITVERTAYINKLIRRGYVKVIESKKLDIVEAPRDMVEEIAPVVEAEQTGDAPISKADLHAPSKAASRPSWLQFLDNCLISYPEGATRSDLIRLWEASDLYGRSED